VDAGLLAIAGAVKGVSGMWLPTLSMALLGLFMPPAAALIVLPSLLTNIAQCMVRTGERWRGGCGRCGSG